MEEASARAELVDAGLDFPSGAVTTTIPRRAVDEALSIHEWPVDLVLDVTRYTGEGEKQTAEAGKIAIEWEREGLEALLMRSDGETVTLSFDARAMLQALEPDVELHGLRQAGAVLAVAVVAGSAAGIAQGSIAPEAGSAGVPSGLAPGAGIEAVRSAEPLVGAAATVPGAGIEAVRSSEPLTGAAATAPGAGIEAVRSAEPLTGTAATEVPGAGIEAVRSATPMPGTEVAGVPGAGIEAVRSAEAARSAEAVSVQVASATDEGFGISMPSPETTAVLIGGFALLITGAAFAARTRRPTFR